MLDPNALSQLVQQEIQTSVQQEVDAIVKQTDWIAELERQIITHVQDRITARFSNIATVPDLVNTVEKSVETLFENGFVPDIGKFVKEKTIQKTVDIAVENFVTDTLNNLTVDSQWINKIQNLVNQTMVDKLKQSINGVDINQTLTDIVLENQDTLIDALKQDFATQSIRDQAVDLQLTIMDGAVVIENELYTNDLNVERNSHLKGDLSVDGDLAIKGRVNVDNASWQELADSIGDKTYKKIKDTFSYNLKDELLDRIKDGIEIQDVTVNGSPLLYKGELANNVTGSHLTKVGNLKNLSVTGRIGVNTENPTNALSIWEEEVAIGIGKHQLNTAYIGTTKKQGLNIGTNQQSSISIDNEGNLWVKNLQIGRNKISHATSVPGHSGTKGDVVFNTNYKKGDPFAWMCLGAFRWAELKA